MPGTPEVGTHYGDTSIAEDVSNIIYQITPLDTPFYNSTGDTTASAVVHEWQQRELTTRRYNAVVEGFTYTFTGHWNLPSRTNNRLQIFNKEIRVSNTQEAIVHHAIDSVFADQTQIRMAEYKTDKEHTFIQGTLASGNTGAVRQMIGMIQAIVSGVTTYTDGAGGTSMSETNFNNCIQTCWDVGGEPRDVLVGGTAKRHISTYTGGSSTKFVAAADRQQINTVDQYISDFFPVNIHLSRDIPKTGDLIGSGSLYTGFGFLFIDTTMIKKANLRGDMVKRVPETADSHDGVIVGECTLEWGHPNAHYYVDQVQASVS